MTDKKPSFIDQFFKGSDLTLEQTITLVREGLKGADYGEFYQEITEGESIVKEKGQFRKIETGNGNAGFSFRVGQGERVGFNHSDEFNAAVLKGAIEKARKILRTDVPAVEPKPSGRVEQELYPQINPVKSMPLAEKIEAINQIETFAKSLLPANDGSAILDVGIEYSAASKSVHIITADGKSLTDRKPTAQMSLKVTVKDKDGKVETGQVIMGGRVDCKDIFNKAAYEAAAKEALHQAEELLRAVEAPAGRMDVVLGPGWPSVILHEAVGHGLEADFNRKGISVYNTDKIKIGTRVASDEVTVVEQGDIPGERGSLHFDDEGTPTRRNVLIEKGILKGYINDRQNAQLMNADLTGNGRRQTYAHRPMPRMTNTYFENGRHDPADIIKSVKDGGQVDITSGKFNMNATLGYRIRDGKLCEPVKGATLIGDGLEVIGSIAMVGNDLKLEKSRGMCGKNRQSVPVGSGQPTILVKNMTVGGRGK